MTTIQVRTNEVVKEKARKIFSELGLDLSTGINLYLVQVVKRKGIPFEILTENGMTPAEERRILREIAWAEKHGKQYDSTEEMFKDILGH